MLDQLHEYLLVIREQVLPKSEAGQAIAYVLKNWTALTRYCGDGDLSIDNNGTERSLRGFAIGRTTGPSSGAITEAGQRRCCAALSRPANWPRSIRLPGSAMSSDGSQTTRSNGSMSCCRTAGPRPALSRSLMRLAGPSIGPLGVHVMDTDQLYTCELAWQGIGRERTDGSMGNGFLRIESCKS